MKPQPNKPVLASDSQPRHIGILAYPGVALLDAVGPLEVFAAANIVLAERSPRCAKAYQVEIWSEHVGAIDGSCGVSLNATRSIAAAAPFELDTLIVAGSPGAGNLVSRPCVDWLREATGGIRRVGGICTGVFLLAEAGLLDGCRAVTHWAFCDELARRYPAIRVEPDPIFLRDGRFYTTAGMTAGMDLALALVQDDLGRNVALATAQLLVVFLKRPGGQSQFSAQGHVRIRVEACGVCHSDTISVDGLLPIQYPRVPGHEAVGKIDFIGPGVEGWHVGQRVGVGFLGGNCGYCEYCRDGDLVNCTNQAFTGVQHDGGYAEVMIAKASGLMSVPDDLSAVAAAPLLCAGLTTFSALRNAPARAGDLIAVFGVGGLGHLSVQYARHMGFEVVAIDRGDDRAELSKKLGAHHYIDSSAADVAKALQERGGAQVVLATASGGKAVAAVVGGLRRGGVVISLGASDEPIELSAFELLFKQLGVEGALTGTPKAGDATLRFSAMSDVAAMVETMPLECAPEAYARMMSGQARFRMVLTMA